MNYKILLFLLILSMNHLNAQKNTSVYLELLGNATLYSMNIDHQIIPKYKIGLRFGTSYNKLDTPVLHIVNHVQYILGHKHAFEIGVGLTSILELNESENNIYAPSGSLQYRYSHNLLLIRAGLNPTILEKSNNDIINPLLFLIYPGVSIGLNF